MSMQSNHSISIVLDKRRAKKSSKYPVKLRVYIPTPKKQKLYPTNFEYSEKEFDSIWNTLKTRNEFKEAKSILRAIEEKAEEVARSLKPFTFEQFEKKLFRKSSEASHVVYHYEEAIREYEKRKQFGTADVYRNSSKSLTKFVKSQKQKDFKNFTFYDITPSILKDYEDYMLDIKGGSVNTIGIYLRALRAIFNKAIADKEIEEEFSPFGKRKYQVPASTNTKKALNNEQLGKLFTASTQILEQEKARDFWFFSYACSGMNIKDIVLLKHKDIKGDKIEFYRAKTFKTSKGHLKPITVYLNDFAKEVIEKYGNEFKSPESLVFSIISSSLTPEEQWIKGKSFTRFVNQHLKNLAKENGLPETISSNWARHSFATNSIRKGATMEFMQESLGHNNIRTTQNYFAGFDNDIKKEFSKSLMDF